MGEKLMNNLPSRLHDELMAQEALIDAEKKKIQGKPNITPLQINSKGELDEAKSLALENSVKPLTFADRLLGRTLTKDTQVTNPETGETKLETYSNYRPGLLTDFAAGMNENYNQDFEPTNLGNNTGAYGNKGFVYRLGEGLGSVAKILAGAGGDAFTAGYNGLNAAQNRQDLRIGDQLYREVLNKRNINTDGIRGYLSPNVFNKLIEAEQLRDNAEYRKMYYDMQTQNQKDMMDYRRMQLAQQEKQDAIDTDIAYKNLGLKEKELAQRGDKVKPLSDTQVKDLINLADALNDVDGIIAKYSDSKYDAGFGISGAVRRNPLTSIFDPLATEMRQDIDLFRKTVARAKEGGRLTDQDQKYYEKAVLNPNLSREDFLSLAREFKNNIEQQRDTALDMYELQGKNVNNFRDYYQREQKGNTTQNGIKYEVID